MSETLVERCPRCGQVSDGSYWVFPSWWTEAQALEWWRQTMYPKPSSEFDPGRMLEQNGKSGRVGHR